MYKMIFTHKRKKDLVNFIAETSLNVYENEYINKEIPCEYYTFVYKKRGQPYLVLGKTLKGFKKCIRRSIYKNNNEYCICVPSKYKGDKEWENVSEIQYTETEDI